MKTIRLTQEILNKAFRDHFSQYSDEFEYDEAFDENIYLSYIDLNGKLEFCNKEEIESDEPYVFYHLFTEDLFEYIDVLEDYYSSPQKLLLFKKEVEEGFKKLGYDVEIVII